MLVLVFVLWVAGYSNPDDRSDGKSQKRGFPDLWRSRPPEDTLHGKLGELYDGRIDVAREGHDGRHLVAWPSRVL